MKIRYYIIIISLLLIAIIIVKVTKIPESLIMDSEEEYPFHYSNRSLSIIIPNLQKENYKKLTAFEKLFNITSLLETKDSIAIRLWLQPVSPPFKFLITMKSNHNKWSGKLLIIKYNTNDKNNIEKTELDKTPLSGWAKLIEKISHYGIFALSTDKKREKNFDEENLKGYWFGGITYWVEVINEKYYRFYSYENPAEYCDESYENYYFNQIVTLLEKEFGIVEEFDL
jgi:hypothetical protein